MNTNGTTPKFLPPHTARVKADGDGLFRDQKYSEASVKYTGAINFANEENFDSKMKAVLYANRALCYKNMKRFEEAEVDAIKATELDPSYAKGWTRLAAIEDAGQCFSRAVVSWQRALDALPSNRTLTTLEINAKHEYEAYLAISLENLKKQGTNVDILSKQGLQVLTPPGQAPWDRASALLQLLGKKADKRSSIWSVAEARKTFVGGITALRTAEWRQSYRRPTLRFPFAQGLQVEIEGRNLHFDDLLYLSDAILLNDRVFSMYDRRFPEELPKIVDYYRELAPLGAFEYKIDYDLHKFSNDFLDVLCTKGSEFTSPRIAIIIRSWILLGHKALRIDHDYSAAFRWIYKAFDIITWVRRDLWHEVIPVEEAGVVFEDLFYVSVHCAILDIYQRAVSSNVPKFTLPDLLDAVTKLKETVKSIEARYIVGSQNMCHELQLIAYPRAFASVVEGYFYQQYSTSGMYKDIGDSKGHLKKAHQCYLDAAALYPEDDEYHTFTLKLALDCLLALEAPLNETIPLAMRVTDAARIMLPIWEFSTLMQHGSSLSPYGPLKTQLEDVEAYAKGSVRSTWIPALSAPS